MDNIIIAYLAGIIDADGSIFIARRSPGKARRVKTQHTLVIVVNQIQPQAIQLLQQTFGGHITQYQPKALKATTWIHKRPLWTWRVYSALAGSCLIQIQPYLRIKSHQAELGINLCQTFHNNYHKIPDEILAQRDLIWQTMRNLNCKVGKGHHCSQKLTLFVS